VQAESAYRQAIRLQPGFSLSFARLATPLRGKLPDADLEAIELISVLCCHSDPSLGSIEETPHRSVRN
jgi:hypothetical protein